MGGAWDPFLLPDNPRHAVSSPEHIHFAPLWLLLTLGKDNMAGIKRQSRESHDVLGFSLCPQEMTKWVDTYPCHWNSEPLPLGSTPAFGAQQCCALRQAA